MIEAALAMKQREIKRLEWKRESMIKLEIKKRWFEQHMARSQEWARSQ